MTNKLPSYNPHFNCSWSMLGTVANGAVFSYLLDKYRVSVKTGSDSYFMQFSARDISYSRCLDIKTVNKALNRLQEMGLISLSGTERKRSVHIYLEKFNGAIRAYGELPYRSEEAEEFVNLLSAGDYNGLKKYGYEPTDNAKFDISQMRSDVDVNGKNPTQDEDMGNFPHSDNKWEISHMQESYMGNFPHFDALKREFSQIIWEISHTFITENSSKREISHLLKGCMGNFLHNDEIESIVSILFAEDTKNLSEIPQELVVFALFLCGKFPTCMWEKSHLGVGNFPHSNKIINNIIKEKPQIFDLRQKGKEFFEEENKFYQEEEQETSSCENFEEGQEPDVKLPELDLNLMAERNAQQYKKIKHKQNLPFLPEEDVRRWASDIRECLDRPDKLFLHYLYEIGHRIFDTEEVTDDEGNIITEHNTSIDKWQCYDVRVIPDLLTPAMDSLMEAVEAGKVVVDDEELPVEINEEDVDPSFVELLIDWDKIPSSLNEGGYLYVITPDKYKNIYAEEVPVVKKERNFEERKKKIDDNNAYLHKLILLAQWEDTYEQLTCLEKTVFNFADTFFQLDDNTLKPVDIKKQSEMSQFRHTALKNSLQRFKMEKLETPLTWDDFTSIFYGTKIDQNECLYLETRMFDADLIRRYHALHNLHSIVDEQNLDELIEDYTEVEA